jgi:MFS family permease
VQAVAGGLIISGHATIWALAVLALVYGLADGFVIPTSQGLIPAIVSSTRLQQANALLGLSRSIVGVLGPALGGVLVGVGSPGGALLVDAASFGLALLPFGFDPRSEATVEPEPFLAELRAGGTSSGGRRGSGRRSSFDRHCVDNALRAPPSPSSTTQRETGRC